MGGTSNCDFRHAGEVEIGRTLVWTPCRMPSGDMKAEESIKHFGCRTMRARAKGLRSAFSLSD